MFTQSVKIAIAASLLAAGSARATLWQATASNLASVMASVKGGDTVKLTGGFGVTRLTNKNFSSLVTIDASAASFSNTLLLNNVSNLSILGGQFGSSTANTSYNKAVSVTGGSNISFVAPSVTGYYAGQGISFQGTSNVSVTNATLSKLHAGVVFSGVNNGTIKGNSSIAAVGDGFDLVDSSHIDVGFNRCTGSTPTVGAHPDCVQMFSSSRTAAPLSHISIHDNYAGGMTQGFDDFGSNPGDSYISIVNNRIDGLMPRGIACDYCVNSTLTGNIVTSLNGAQYLVTLTAQNGVNNVVSANSIGTFNRAAALQTVFATRAQLIGKNDVAAMAAGAVPEPSSWIMLVAGFGLIGISRRHQRQHVLS